MNPWQAYCKYQRREKLLRELVEAEVLQENSERISTHFWIEMDKKYPEFRNEIRAIRSNLDTIEKHNATLREVTNLRATDILQPRRITRSVSPRLFWQPGIRFPKNWWKAPVLLLHATFALCIFVMTLGVFQQSQEILQVSKIQTVTIDSQKNAPSVSSWQWEIVPPNMKDLAQGDSSTMIKRFTLNDVREDQGVFRLIQENSQKTFTLSKDIEGTVNLYADSIQVHVNQGELQYMGHGGLPVEVQVASWIFSLHGTKALFRVEKDKVLFQLTEGRATLRSRLSSRKLISLDAGFQMSLPLKQMDIASLQVLSGKIQPSLIINQHTAPAQQEVEASNRKVEPKATAHESLVHSPQRARENYARLYEMLSSGYRHIRIVIKTDQKDVIQGELTALSKKSATLKTSYGVHEVGLIHIAEIKLPQ